jgi:HK97 family phage portal protein
VSGAIAQAWDMLDGLRRDRVQKPQAAVPISGVKGDEGLWAAFTGSPLPGVAAQVVSAANVARITAVHACDALISGAIATLPVKTYERLERGQRRELFDDDFWWLLNEEMHPRWAAATGWEFVSSSMLLRGEGFFHIDRRGARVAGLRPIHPQLMDVRVNPDNPNRLVYFETPEPEDNRPVGRVAYDQDDILHIPGFRFDGVRGISPLRNQLAGAGALALATQEYAQRFFSNGARPDYILQTDGEVGAEKLAAMRSEVDATMAGPANWRRPMLLTGGVKFQSITMPLEDVELLGLRQFQVEEIARAFGVPPFMIGHNEKTTSWGSGVDAMGIGFVRYTLAPYLNRITNELNRKLIRGGRRFLAFDTTELERADTKSLFESFRIALGRAGEPAFMTVDEVRNRLNMESKGGASADLPVSAMPDPAVQQQLAALSADINRPRRRDIERDPVTGLATAFIERPE